jgi:hypothetical protein
MDGESLMPPETEGDWKRLGRLLADRRIEIAARYKNKNLFAEERQINRRMLWAIEAGVRDTYTPDTLRAIERSYMLAPGSIERTLAGGGLEPVAESRAALVPFRPAAPSGPPADEGGQVLADLLARFAGDEVIRAISTQSHKPAYALVGEILRWRERQGDADTAREVLAGILGRHPDDEVMAAISRQGGKKASMVAEEVLDWLASQGPAWPQARNGTAG